MSPFPAVSVIIATYNAPDTCVATVRSLEDTKVALEVVIVDDGSTPENHQQLEKGLDDYKRQSGLRMEMGSTAVLCVYQQNTGAYRARFAGVAAATGEYVKFLDHDDRLIPGALLKEVGYARQESADVVMTDWYEGWLEDRSGPEPVLKIHHRSPEYVDPLTDFLEIGGVYTGAALYRKDLFHDLEPITAWTPRLKDDWATFGQICLANSGKRFVTLHEPSYVWCHHAAQLTASAHPAENIAEIYRFLGWFDEALEHQGQYDRRRRCAMAQYYMKNALILCEHQPSEWNRTALRIAELCPVACKSLAGNRFAKLCVDLFGARQGVINYVRVKRLFGLA